MAPRKLSKIQVDDERINRWQDHVIGVLNPVLDVVGSQRQPWQRPDPTNGWALTKVGFYRDAAMRVHVRGAASGGAAFTPCFVLPIGYRPGQDCALPVVLTGGAFGYVSITAGGGVAPSGNANLDGLSFLAEQ